MDRPVVTDEELLEATRVSLRNAETRLIQLTEWSKIMEATLVDVLKMREAQKAYYESSGAKSLLGPAKAREAVVDSNLKQLGLHVPKNPETTQNKLF